MKLLCRPYFFKIIVLANTMIFGPYCGSCQLADLIPEVQPWSFVKYGNPTTNLYTGTVSTSIPVYTYKDSDFEIPITLDYSSNGYIPNRQTGTLGLGWYLNAGGVITREINGIVDDGYESFDGRYCYGFFKLFKNKAYEPFENFLGKNNQYTSRWFYITMPNDDNMRVETEPDRFHFRFGKHSGDFSLSYDGKVEVYNTSGPAAEYSIDMTELNHWAIRIKTGDGYTYKFGNTKYSFLDRTEEYYGYDEYYANFFRGAPKNDKSLTWYLDEIIAPNGRTVKFEYSVPKRCIVVVPQAVKICYEASTEHGSGFFNEYDKVAGKYNNPRNLFYNKFISKPTRIVIDNKIVVDFNYREKPAEKALFGYLRVPLTSSTVIPSEAWWSLENLGLVDFITVSRLNVDSTKTELKRCNMSYYTSSVKNGNPITFLEKVEFPGEGAYMIDYYARESMFPLHGTSGLDHWGYYNNRNEYWPSNLIPGLGIDDVYNEYIMPGNVSREPDMAGAIKGMLKQITYPTGGYTKYTYEPHDFSKMLRRNDTSYGLPYLDSLKLSWFMGDNSVNPVRIAGGLRIKKITDYSSDGDSTSREFIYTNLKNDNKSSGILLSFPRYNEILHAKYDNSFDNYFNEVRRASYSLVVNSIDQTHVEYGQIREKFSDSSYVDHYYSNYNDTPDDTVRGRMWKITSDVGVTIFYPQYALNMRIKPTSYHKQRGVLLKKKYYDNRGVLVAKDEYNYDKSVSLKYSEFVKPLPSSYSHWVVHRMLTEDYRLDNVVKVQYFGNDSIVDKTAYTYNEGGQTSTVERTDSRGVKYWTYNQYLADMDAGQKQAIHNTMIERNIVQFPVKTETHIQYPGKAKQVTGGTRTIFGQFNGLIKMSQQQQLVIVAPVAQSGFQFDSFAKTMVTYNDYDSRGNLLKATSRNGISTHYIWGYDDAFPIAKAEGPAELTSDQNKSYFYYNSFEDDPDAVNLISAKTGTKGSAQKTHVIDLARFAPGTYTLSYWLSYDGIEWVQRKRAVTVGSSSPNTLSITNDMNYMDEIKFVRDGLLMTAYTYDPYIGVLSKSDYNDNIVKYSYDDAGRLITVKDKNNNLLESYEYNYNHKIYSHEK